MRRRMWAVAISTVTMATLAGGCSSSGSDAAPITTFATQAGSVTADTDSSVGEATGAAGAELCAALPDMATIGAEAGDGNLSSPVWEPTPGSDSDGWCALENKATDVAVRLGVMSGSLAALAQSAGYDPSAEIPGAFNGSQTTFVQSGEMIYAVQILNSAAYTLTGTAVYPHNAALLIAWGKA